VPILRPLIPQQGHLAAYQQSNALIISDSASNVARLHQIIRRIDQSVSDEVEVIRLEHANAADVVRIVKQLRQPGPQAATSYNLVSDERTNSVLLSGDKQERVRIRALISHMDIPLQEGIGDTHVVYLRYANAVEMVDVLTGVSESLTREKSAAKTPKGITGSANLSRDVMIQADENNNALIINAPAGVMRSLRAVIQQLDIRRAQIHVEAVLAEVSYEKAREFGIQWAFDGSEGGTKAGPIGVLNFPQSGTPITGLLESPPAVGSGLSLGIGSFTNGELTLAAYVRAVAGDGNTNILQTPTLVTLDNEEASIVVGQNVPFLTGSYANTGGGSTPLNPFQTIERQDVGVTLRITPQINEGSTIKMNINQEVSTIASGTEGVDLITNKRQIVTNVLVDDDQILVLGGLIEDALQDSEQKVPYLGDIPVLGWAFKYNQVKKVKTNLMAFIHPTIIDDELIANDFTRSKYNHIRDKQIVQRERGVAMLDNNEAPIMAPYNSIPPLPPRYEPAGNKGEVAPPGSL
jgi:general secretion pathway protein D